MWERHSPKFKKSGYPICDFFLNSSSVDDLPSIRNEKWLEIESLAIEHGFKREDFDLSNTVKKITLSESKNFEGEVLIEKKTNFLKRPFHWKRKLTEEEKAFLPLPLNSVCKWIGLTPFPIGMRGSTYRNPLGEYDSFLLSPEFKSSGLSDDEVMPFSKYSLIEGAWDTNQSALRDMATPPSKRVPSAKSLILNSLKRYDRFGFPQIKTIPGKNLLASATCNPDANPGLISSKFLGVKKRDTFSQALKIAGRIWDTIKSERTYRPDLSLWSIGGRARRQNLTDFSVKPESRIILMPEHPNSMISSVIGQLFALNQKKMIQADPSLESFMGHDTNNLGWKRIANFEDKGNWVVELDWSRFDTTIPEPILVASFCLLRSCFPTSRFIDKLFIFVMSGFIYKNVAIKQRFIYKICQGIPSGSPLTSIIGTISNWISLNWIITHEDLFGINGDDFKLAVAGDDTLISFKKKIPNLDFVGISKSVKDSINLEIKIEDMTICPWWGYGSVYDWEFCPSFLKTVIWNGLPGRRVTDIVKSISCPESKVKKFSHWLKILEGYVSIPILNPKGLIFLKTFSDFISRKWGEENNVRFNSFSNMFSQENSYMQLSPFMNVKSGHFGFEWDGIGVWGSKWTGSPSISHTRETWANSISLGWFGLFSRAP